MFWYSKVGGKEVPRTEYIISLLLGMVGIAMYLVFEKFQLCRIHQRRVTYFTPVSLLAVHQVKVSLLSFFACHAEHIPHIVQLRCLDCYNIAGCSHFILIQFHASFCPFTDQVPARLCLDVLIPTNWYLSRRGPSSGDVTRCRRVNGNCSAARRPRQSTKKELKKGKKKQKHRSALASIPSTLAG